VFPYFIEIHNDTLEMMLAWLVEEGIRARIAMVV